MDMKIRIAALLVTALFGVLTLVQGAEYHVAVTGNDLNSGATLATPWRTLQKANAVASAGDIVLVHGGSYSDGIHPVNHGFNGHPITFQVVPGERVLLITSVGVQLGSMSSHIVVDGFEVHASYRMAELTGSAYITIRNCSFHGGRGNYSAFSLDGASYCVIQNNYLDRQDPDGSSDIGDDPTGGDGLRLIGTSHHNLIEGNTVTRCEHVGFASSFSKLDAYQSYNIWRDNRSFNNHTNFSLQDGVVRCVFENNTGYYMGLVWTGGNGWCFQFTGTSCIVRFNTLYDDTGTVYTARQWPGTVGTMTGSANGSTPSLEFNKVYNNTVYSETDQQGWAKDGWRWENYRQGYRQNDNMFKNNIVASAAANQVNDIDIYNTFDGMHNSYDGNLFAGKGGAQPLIRYESTTEIGNYTLSQIRQKKPLYWGSANREGDPRFVNVQGQGSAKDFSLRANSPAIDAGVHLTTATQAGSGTTLSVDEAGYFCDGWGIPGVQGDSILIEGHAPVGIASVDYGSNILTLNAARSWAQGARIFYYRSDRYQGSAPDIGAHEFGASSYADPTIVANRSSIDFGDIALYDTVSVTIAISMGSGSRLIIDSISTRIEGLEIRSERTVLWTRDTLVSTVKYYPTRSRVVQDTIFIWNNSGTSKLALPVLANVMPMGAIHFGNGWNMVSFPRVLSNHSADILFPYLENPFYSIDRVNQSYVRQTTLGEGVGYMIYCSRDTSVLVAGDSIGAFQTSVGQAGWVLIGSLTRPIPVESVLFSPSDAQGSPMNTYDTKLGKYLQAAQLVPGRGYWVYVSKPCSIRW
jgi:hypothetical protein